MQRYNSMTGAPATKGTQPTSQEAKRRQTSLAALLSAKGSAPSDARPQPIVGTHGDWFSDWRKRQGVRRRTTPRRQPHVIQCDVIPTLERCRGSLRHIVKTTTISYFPLQNAIWSVARPAPDAPSSSRRAGGAGSELPKRKKGRCAHRPFEVNAVYLLMKQKK